MPAMPGDDAARLPPPPPLPPLPPPPSQLTQLFHDHKASLACQWLLQKPRAATEELRAAFRDVEWAPAAFLLTLAQWPADGPRDVFFSLVAVASDCMRERAAPPTPMVQDLAGTLLLSSFSDCRAHTCASFVAAFGVSLPHLHSYCAQRLPQQVKVVVTLLDVLHQRALLPLVVVLAAAIQQKEFDAADVHVRDDATQQRRYVQMLIDRNVPDKVIKKRLSKFQLRDREFPEFHARRVRASLRFLIYTQRYDDALSLVHDSAELALYACRVVLNERGAQDFAARLFIYRAGHAATDEFAYIETADLTTALFPNKDDLEPLASCLSIAEVLKDANAGVVFVDTPSALAECVAHLKQAPVVGFDCEWKAATSRDHQVEACAVLQLASATRVFVVDMIALKHQCSTLCEVLSSATIMKLGFDTKGDVSVLAKVLLQEHEPQGDLVRNLIDVQALAKRLRNVKRPRLATAADRTDGVEEGEIEEGEEDQVANDSEENGVSEIVDTGQTEQQGEELEAPTNGKKKKNKKKRGNDRANAAAESDRDSLATVAKQYLGKPLDKRSRMSDWERRPLTTAQLHYAAMDALVLVAIFDAMRERFSPDDFNHALAQVSRPRSTGAALPTAATVAGAEHQ